jgi:hypothetical protein
MASAAADTLGLLANNHPLHQKRLVPTGRKRRPYRSDIRKLSVLNDIPGEPKKSNNPHGGIFYAARAEQMRHDVIHRIVVCAHPVLHFCIP